MPLKKHIDVGAVTQNFKVANCIKVKFAFHMVTQKVLEFLVQGPVQDKARWQLI